MEKTIYMKLERYIGEDISMKRADEIAEVVLRDCQPFIEQIVKKRRNGIDGTDIYRATFGDIGDIRKTQSRLNDRKPKDTPKLMHEAMNIWFKRKFGWPVRNGIFTATQVELTLPYGKPYLFYPIGNFKYVYSKTISDLFANTPGGSTFTYEDLEKPEKFWRNRVRQGVSHFQMDGVVLDEYEDLMKHILDKYNIDLRYSGNLSGPIQHGFTDLYDVYVLTLKDGKVRKILKYAIDKQGNRLSKEKFLEDTRKEVDNKLYNFLENANYTDTGLVYANLPPQGVEVIFNCQEYYLISLKYTQHLTMKIFGYK